MTTQQRLEAITALTKAATHLAERNNDKTKLIMALQEMQTALDALNIDSLSVEDSSYKMAKELLNIK